MLPLHHTRFVVEPGFRQGLLARGIGIAPLLLSQSFHFSMWGGLFRQGQGSLLFVDPKP